MFHNFAKPLTNFKNILFVEISMKSSME